MGVRTNKTTKRTTNTEELRPSLLRWPGFVNHAVWLKGFEDKGEGDVVDDVFEPGGGFPLHNDIANIPALGNRP